MIEKESRVEVANNIKEARMAEIEANQLTDIREQEANKLVGLKTVENEREVAIGQEKANQLVKEQEKITHDKAMEVVRVQEVKKAEIEKQAQIIKAEQEQKTVEIAAEAQKNAQIKSAEADKESKFLEAAALLEMKDKESQGVQKMGTAEAEALRLKELAPISAQIELAKEIGENQGYQTYLVSIRQIEANQAIGIEQAKAISTADLKIIANGGNVENGVGKIGEIISTKGGMNIGSMLEGLANTEVGKNIMDKFLNKKRPEEK